MRKGVIFKLIKVRNYKQKLTTRATGGKTFQDTTKKRANESSLSWSVSGLKNKSLKCKKREKLAFEISNWVEKIAS